MNVLGLCALLAVTVASPVREKRQAACLSAFQNIANVCQSNPTGQVFFTHPTDPTKFLQCDVYSRMYIIQCPVGEEFSIITSGCQPTHQNQQPATTTTTTTTTVAPPSPRVPPTLSTVQQVVPTASNPCSASNTAMGQLYFPYPGDRTRFIECDLQGHPNVMTCPNLLVWEQSVLSCLYDAASSQSNPWLTTTPAPQFSANQPNNPCTESAIRSGRLFFPYPSDSNKYIQCDLWGQAFLNSCPPRLAWNAALETCYSPFLQAVPSG